jgi:hypothetical protein
LHRRVAEALREEFAKSGRVEPELLAHHFTQAGLTEAAVAGGARRDNVQWSARRWSRLRRSSPALSIRSQPYPPRPHCVAKRSSFRSRSQTL